MNIDEVIFIDNLPSLDLHGFDRDTARVAINDFINDNKKMGNSLVVIIHGIGSGIIKQTTNQTLTRNKNVITFKSHYFNRGCTIAQINIK